VIFDNGAWEWLAPLRRVGGIGRDAALRRPDGAARRPYQPSLRHYAKARKSLILTIILVISNSFLNGREESDSVKFTQAQNNGW